jgi:hypothetical protein
LATTTDAPEQSETEAQEDETTLYRHQKRPQWGVAILAWEKDTRRAYQFEDGRLRRIKKGYYNLMQPADDVERSRDAVVQSLQNALKANRGKVETKVQDQVAPFDDQVDLFLTMYPKGFQDEQWIEDHRTTSGRALKRHREPVVNDTRDLLARERCDELIEGDRHDELVESALDILASTSLVAISHVKTLRRISDEEKVVFAERIRELLHGEGDFEERFEAYLEFLTEVFAGRPSWRLATALPALMYPENHVCVRRSAFTRQAGAISPMARYSKRATVRSYKNFRRVAQVVKKRLTKKGHEPRDFLDVYDFIWDTLRDSALDHLGDDEDEKDE